MNSLAMTAGITPINNDVIHSPVPKNDDDEDNDPNKNKNSLPPLTPPNAWRWSGNTTALNAQRFETQATFAMIGHLQSLPDPIRQEYDQAVRYAKALVQRETPYLCFLKTDDWDPARAALRLARYWKFRKYIFGESRWLLPLNQTGRGALTTTDIELLRTGCYVFISRGKEQGPISLHDMSRLPPDAEFESSRIIYYACHVWAEEFCHFDGVTLLYLVTSGRRPTRSFQRQTTFRYLMTGLPLKIKNVYVVQAYEGPGKQELLDYNAYAQAKMIEYNSAGLTRPPRIAGGSVYEMLQSVRHVTGVDAKYLPPSVGGQYFDCYTAFDDWIRQRLSIEDVMAAAPIGTLRLPPHASSSQGRKQRPRQARRRGAKNRSSSTTTATTTTALALPGASATTHNGPTKPQYTYLKRNREIESLQQQQQHLLQENERFRSNNAQLESILIKVRLLLAVYDINNSRNHRNSSGNHKDDNNHDSNNDHNYLNDGTKGAETML